MIRSQNIVYMENLIEMELDKPEAERKRSFDELCAMRSMVNVFKTLMYCEWNTEDNKEIVDKYIRAMILNDVQSHFIHKKRRKE